MKRAERTTGAAAADEALAPPLAGLAGQRREPGERGDLAAIEGAEFGQLGDRVRAMIGRCRARRRADPPSHARPASRERVVDVAVELGELLLAGP